MLVVVQGVLQAVADGWLLATSDPVEPAGHFEKTGLDWQFLQLQRRLGEQLEWWFSQTPLPRPNWSVPESLGQSVLLAIAGIAGLWLGWQLYRLLRHFIWNAALTGPIRASRPTAPDKETELTVAQWVQRSQRVARQGNYGEASRALYLAMVQRLHEAGTIPAEVGRTDGEYLRLVRTLPHAAAYKVLIQTHERLCFGNATISASGFDRCQQAYRQIEAIRP